MNYRITKYNPIFRVEGKGYTKDEWTAISDVGEKYNNIEFTMKEYLSMEKKYCQSIKKFLNAYNITSLKIDLFGSIYKRRKLKKIIGKEKTKKLKKGNILNLEDIIQFSILCLREDIWCMFSGENSTYLHFGDDYYIFIGTDKPEVLFEVPKGIYKEYIDSPYLN